MAASRNLSLFREFLKVLGALLFVCVCLWGIWQGFKATVLAVPSSPAASLSNTQYHEEAIVSLSKDLERYPSHVETYILRGFSFCALKRFDACLRDYDMALQLAPSEVRIYQFRGRAFVSMGKWAEAIREFTLLVNANSSDPSGYFERVELYLKQGKWVEASADLLYLNRLGVDSKVLAGLEAVRDALQLEHEGKLLDALGIYRKLDKRRGIHKSTELVRARMASLTSRINHEGRD